jgi:large subunit ribosomal protein L17
MRHGNYRGQLGVHPGHRRSMLRNLVTSLLKHERIRTTRARAKEARRYAEKMITIAKKDDLASKRRVLAYVRERDVVNKLFKTLIFRYANRKGGYTRIMQLGPRRSDAAQMVFLELVDRPVEAAPVESDKKEKAKTIDATVVPAAEAKPAKPSKKKETATDTKVK